MRTNKPSGLVGRAWKRIKRLMLGKSDPSYLAELVGGDEQCFDRAIAAQLGWPCVKGQREDETVDKASEKSVPASDPPAQSAISNIGPPYREKPAA